MKKSSLSHTAARRLGARVPRQQVSSSILLSRCAKPVIADKSFVEKVKVFAKAPIDHAQEVSSNMNLAWRVTIFMLIPILFGFNVANMLPSGPMQMVVFVTLSAVSASLMGSVVVGVGALMTKFNRHAKPKR